MKIWEKGIETDGLIERFTVGDDRKLDMLLAPYDVIGSLAHAEMLSEVGLITGSEYSALRSELINIYESIRKGTFKIDAACEDIHSQVEFALISAVGEPGKKIHTARSRNDQVLLDIKLFTRDKIKDVAGKMETLFHTLVEKSESFKEVIMPGYTHLQVAMPSSFGLLFGAYAESLTDDIDLLLSTYRLVNRNPLGSGAGYGTSFPISRELTTKILAFRGMNVNSIYAQMTRGKMEKVVAGTLSVLAAGLARMAADLCLFNSQNFGFIHLPDELTTGSSIMPHKKNPDVFELIRAKCNKISALPYQIDRVTANLSTGYFRDYQIIKHDYLLVFDELTSCLELMTYMVHNLEINASSAENPRYDAMYSVEEINRLVIEGIPFRDAYRMVADKIEEGSFKPRKQISHTHEGSIGNLMNSDISSRMQSLLKSFAFEKTEKAYNRLIKELKVYH